MKSNIEILKIISDDSRYEIINLLMSKNYCVKALAKELKISEAAVSQHLSVLRKVNLVSGEKKGYFTHYKVNTKAIQNALSNISKKFMNMKGEKKS